MSPGKGPWYPLNRGMGCPPDWPGRFVEKKNPLTLGGGTNPDLSFVRQDLRQPPRNTFVAYFDGCGTFVCYTTLHEFRRSSSHCLSVGVLAVTNA